MRACIAVGGVALLLGLPVRLAAQQQGADIVKQVVAAWEKRRQAIKAITYKIEGAETYAKGSMTENEPQAHPRVRKNFPPQDTQFAKKVELTLDFPNRKLRNETRDRILMLSAGVFRPQFKVRLYDGKNGKVYTPREENTSAVYTPAHGQEDLQLRKGGPEFLHQDLYPFLFAHGRAVLYFSTYDAAGFFDNSPEASQLRFHRRGLIGERNCVVLRSVVEAGRAGRFDEFWVDLERDGAILRWWAYSRGTASVRLEVSYRQAQGHWLPSAWEFDQYRVEANGLALFRAERMKVTSIVIEPHLAPEIFSVPMKHKMVVYDEQSRWLVVADDDESLVPYGQPTNVRKWWHWVGFGALGLGVLCGLAYWARRRRAAS